MPLVAPPLMPRRPWPQGVGAKPTLTERAKGLTATAIDTTTHLLDQAKIHVTGHGAAPALSSRVVVPASNRVCGSISINPGCRRLLGSAEQGCVLDTRCAACWICSALQQRG